MRKTMGIHNDRGSEIDREIGRIAREFAELLPVDVCEEEVEFMFAIMRLLGLVIATGSSARFAPKCLEFVREEQRRLQPTRSRKVGTLSLCARRS